MVPVDSGRRARHGAGRPLRVVLGVAGQPTLGPRNVVYSDVRLRVTYLLEAYLLFSWLHAPLRRHPADHAPRRRALLEHHAVRVQRPVEELLQLYSCTYETQLPVPSVPV